YFLMTRIALIGAGTRMRMLPRSMAQPLGPCKPDGPLPAPRATGSGLARGLPAHVLAAIGSEVGAGDPGGLLGQEECNRVSDFLRGAEPAERDLRHDLLADMLG